MSSKQRLFKLFSKGTISPILALGFFVLIGASSVTHASLSDRASSTISASAGTLDYKLSWSDSYPEYPDVFTLPPASYPGMPLYSREIVVTNTGSAPMKYSVSFDKNNSDLTTSDANNVIQARILTPKGQIYYGPLSGISSAKSSVSAGASETMTLQITWPPTGDDRKYLTDNAIGVSAQFRLIFHVEAG